MQDTPPPNPLDYDTPPPRRKRNSLRPWINPLLLAAPVIAIFVIVLILKLDALHEAPSRTLRIKSASNLRQIGQAIQLYNKDFKGLYPNTFTDLVLTEDITPNVFIDPLSNDTPATGSTPQAAAANISSPGHCSYIYLGKGLTKQTTTPDMVIAYEKFSSFTAGHGANVLFGDGRVDFVDIQGINSILHQINSGIWPVRYPPQPTTAPTTKR